MKRFTVIAAAALALWTAAGVQARPFEAIQKEGTLRLATEGYYAPFAHFEGKQLTGFEVELAQMMAAKMGVKYEWKTDRKSTRLNSSHLVISYAVFCLKKKNPAVRPGRRPLTHSGLGQCRQTLLQS